MPDVRITINGVDATQELWSRIQAAAQQTGDVVGSVGDRTTAAGESMRAALEHAGQSFDASSTGATALSQAIEGLTPSTKQAGDAFASLRETLTEMWEHPQAALGNFAEAIGHDLTASLGGAETALGAVSVGLGAFAGAVVVAGGAAFELADHAAEVGSAIERASLVTGASAESMSALKFAAEVTGGSLDGLTTMAFMLERRLGDTGATGQKTRDALQQLGISAEDFTQLPIDQQILAISTGFRNLDEGTNKATLAFELFGRQGRDALPTLLQPMDDLVAKAKTLGLTWSDQDVKAAHEFEIQVTTLRLEFEKLALDVGKDLIPIFSAPMQFAEHSLGWILTTGVLGDALGQAKFIADMVTAANAIDNPAFGPTPALPAAPGLFGDTSGIRDYTQAMTEAGLQINDTMVTLAHLQTEQQKARELLAGFTPQVREHADAVGQLGRIYAQVGAVQIPDLTAHTEEMAAAFEDARASMDDLSQIFADSQTPIETLQTSLDGISLKVRDSAQVLRDEMSKTIGLMPDLGAQAGSGWLDGITAKFDTFPQTLTQALLHGGDTMRTVEAFGLQLGQTLAGALNTVLQSQGISGFGQPSSTGGQIGFAGAQVGAGLVAGATASPQTRGETVTHDAAVGAEYGAVAGPIGMGVGAGIGALIGSMVVTAQEKAGRQTEAQFESSFGGFQQMMDAVGKAYEAEGKSAQQAQADVKAMLDVEKEGSDAVTAAMQRINGTMTQQQQDAQELQTAISKYGFTIQELGPALEKQNLDGQAKGLLNDWTLLIQAGVNVGTVNTHMASAMQDFLKVAQQTGTEVPVEMQPMIASMIKQGELTDAAGNKITDITQLGVHFAETMTQGFQSIVDKLQSLIDKIGVALPAAINAVPRTIEINADVSWNVPGPHDQQLAARGGYVTSRGVEYFAVGGFPGGPSGTDTVPAWLTPGEGVLNTRAMALIGRGGLSALNNGAAVGASAADIHDAVDRAMSVHLGALQSLIRQFLTTQPILLRHALRGVR